jgi:hypothetical protein
MAAGDTGSLVEMLRRELEASKSVTDHLQFLRNVAAGETMSEPLRQHLVAHIDEEESEHQAHLVRLLPALESFVANLDQPGAKPEDASPGLTVGNLVDKKPWYAAR